MPAPFVPSVQTRVTAPPVMAPPMMEQVAAEVFVSAEEPAPVSIPEPVVAAAWSSESSGKTTPSGLTRRVAGAQLPGTPVLPTRLAVLDDDLGGDDSPPPPDDEQPEPDAPPANADEVYAFLSNFASGVERGRADANTPEDEEQ